MKSKSSDDYFCESESIGTLYVVATPIGNLADITMRALETLRSVDRIACEDTRVTGVLCKHYGISTPLFAYHEYNSDAVVPNILASLQAGQNIALVSDAGTPLISDPGYRLVVAARAANIRVVPIPGASSILCALSAAGLPTERIHYAGFLPNTSSARKEALGTLAQIDATLVLLESNHRLVDSLRDAAEVLGDTRQAVIGRELTKHFEEFTAGTLSELADNYAARPQVKGEMVLMVAPPEHIVAQEAAWIPLIEALIPHYPTKKVAQMISDTLGGSRTALYRLAQEAKDRL
jgi:16S rRNA (cytidine1402-2'-O)-methyltransferase